MTMIDFIENHFKRTRKFNILADYVLVAVKFASQEYSHWRHVTLRLVSFINRIEEWTDVILKYHKLKNLNIMTSHEINMSKIDLMNMLNLTVKYKHYLVDESDFYKKGDAKILYEDNKIRVIKINTFAASEHFSSGSRGRAKPWCISTRETDWNRYNYDNFRWIFVLVKKSLEKYAIDTRSGFSWNEKNKVTPFSDIVRKYPILFKFSEVDVEDAKNILLEATKEVIQKGTYIFYRSYAVNSVVKRDKFVLRLVIRIDSFTTVEALKNEAERLFDLVSQKSGYPLISQNVERDGSIIFAEYGIS